VKNAKEYYMHGIIECIVNSLPEVLSKVLGVSEDRVIELINSGKLKAAITPDPKLGDYGISLHTVLKDVERDKWNEVGNTIAMELYSSIRERCWVEQVSFVDGYINVTINYSKVLSQLVEELGAGKVFNELAKIGAGLRVIVEHTSANPVHPLHIGSGRNSVLGDTYARLLKKLGFEVQTRFYVNDLGRQMATLVYGVSIVKSSGIERPGHLKPDHWLGIIYALTNTLIDLSRLRLELKKKIDDLVKQADIACREFAENGEASNIPVELGFALCELTWKSSLKFESLKHINKLYDLIKKRAVENNPTLGGISNILKELLELAKEYRKLSIVERRLSVQYPELYNALKSGIKDHVEAESAIRKLMQFAENCDRETLEVFKKTAESVVEGFKETLGKINIKFDGFDYESNNEILGTARDIVKELIKTGYARVVGGGAVEIDLNVAAKDHEYVKNLFYPDQAGRFIVQRSDGTTLYVTRDIAYTIYKFKVLGARRVYNVIAVEQSREQKQLKAALYILGYVSEAENLYHFAYEMVHLKGMRMSGRRGIYYSMDELFTDSKLSIMRKLLEKESAIKASELADIASKLAVANIRALLLSVDPGKVMVFDPSKIGEVEYGTTIEYAFVRAQGIIRNLWGIEFLDDPGSAQEKMLSLRQFLENASLSPEEKRVLEALTRFKNVLVEAYREMKPNKLLEYAVNLALEFNKFYEKYSIIGERDITKRSARIALTTLVLIVLSELMDIMGMPKLRKM